VKFKLQVDGKEYVIAAAADGSITINGEAFETKTGVADPDRRTIQVGDKSYEVRVVESTDEVGCFTLEVAGERVPLTVSDLVRETPSAAASPAAGATTAAAEADAGAGASGDGAAQPGAQGGAAAEGKDGLFAPVPGKIVDVFVKAGDSVEEGAPLVVLEAMKMENELRAPKKGAVTAVFVKKGDNADRGQLLVAIE
jgi:glutaconyl-CoA/methylmalonyl-CoA decarboxylase subunit gamma